MKSVISFNHFAFDSIRKSIFCVGRYFCPFSCKCNVLFRRQITFLHIKIGFDFLYRTFGVYFQRSVWKVVVYISNFL